MFNYSDNGLYFEADIFLNPGAEVFIAIEASPFCNSTAGHEFYLAVIKHCSELDDANFHYGCGAQIIDSFGSATFDSK
jgi:hypothetical protein